MDLLQIVIGRGIKSERGRSETSTNEGSITSEGGNGKKEVRVGEGDDTNSNRVNCRISSQSLPFDILTFQNPPKKSSKSFMSARTLKHRRIF